MKSKHNKILVVGSRSWNDRSSFNKILSRLINGIKNPWIVSGGAKGPDGFAIEYAKLRGITFTEILPDWDEKGKKAGILRNIEMLDFIKDSNKLVIAFWDKKSKGTKFTIDESRKRNYPTIVITR